jgi:ribose transport system ATP-binding protein
MNQTILELKNISKFYPGVQALKDVDFELKIGEVHVLIGENGAGKSTMGNLIIGAEKPNTGNILFEGREQSFESPADAICLGIAGVNQELMLIPWLNAAQNIFLNREPRNKKFPFIIDYKKMNKDAQEILKSIGGSNIQVSRPIKLMSAAQKQMVEIAKVLVMNPKVVIFDEPTAILSEEEVDRLFFNDSFVTTDCDLIT